MFPHLETGGGQLPTPGPEVLKGLSSLGTFGNLSLPLTAPPLPVSKWNENRTGRCFLVYSGYLSGIAINKK